MLLDPNTLWLMVLQVHGHLILMKLFSLFIIGRRPRREAVRFTRSQHPRPCRRRLGRGGGDRRHGLHLQSSTRPTADRLQRPVLLSGHMDWSPL
jgi:hypothetical protein